MFCFECWSKGHYANTCRCETDINGKKVRTGDLYFKPKEHGKGCDCGKCS